VIICNLAQNLVGKMNVMANCSGVPDCSYFGEVGDNIEEQDGEDLTVRVNCSREEGEEKQFVCLLLDPIPFDPILESSPTQSSEENRFDFF